MDHGKADAFSCLPSGDNNDFDRKQSGHGVHHQSSQSSSQTRRYQHSLSIVGERSSYNYSDALFVKGGHQSTPRSVMKSKSSRNCQIHSVSTTDVLSMHQELSFHRWLVDTGDLCGRRQNKPSKPTVHPWMLPEKPWSHLHVDHAINFMGTNLLVITYAFW